MNDFKKCPVCKEYGWFNSEFEGHLGEHKCKPRWNVWDEDEADQYSTEEFRIVRAKTAAEAAERCAWEMNDDGPARHRLYVRRFGSTYPAELFAVDYEINVEYTAKPVTLSPAS